MSMGWLPRYIRLVYITQCLFFSLPTVWFLSEINACLIPNMHILLLKLLEACTQHQAHFFKFLPAKHVVWTIWVLVHLLNRILLLQYLSLEMIAVKTLVIFTGALRTSLSSEQLYLLSLFAQSVCLQICFYLFSFFNCIDVYDIIILFSHIIFISFMSRIVYTNVVYFVKYCNNVI